jgi:hypothetical protein
MPENIGDLEKIIHYLLEREAGRIEWPYITCSESNTRPSLCYACQLQGACNEYREICHSFDRWFLKVRA